MFNYLENKYSKAYFRIIANARLRPVPFTHWRKRHLNDQYYEAHHEHPSALGGTDTVENLVFLTAKEHFVVHLLLTKMLEGPELKSMQYALNHMLKIPKKMQDLRYVPTGRTFEIARRAAADAARGNKETAAKISASHTGKTLSEEHKKKISEGGKGKHKVSDAHAAIISATHSGKPKSEASKEKMRHAWIARRERIALGLEVRKPMSERAKQNISAAKIGKKLESPRAPYTKQALTNLRDAAALRRGKPLSVEHRAKISSGLNTFYDKGHT
jgi:hypothetical protein